MKICDDPIRHVLSQETEKKGLFSKKSVTMYALGDENEQPLTAYEFISIESCGCGLFAAARKKGEKPIILDSSGAQLLKAYSDKSYAIRCENGLLCLSRGAERGLAAIDGSVLVEPKGNFLKVEGDIVLYGKVSSVGPDYNETGIGRIEGNKLVPVVPCVYNHVQVLWDRVVAAGRYVVTTTRTATSLTRDTVTKTTRLAFELYSADTGEKVSDLIFGEIHRTQKGNYSAKVYPNIKSAELTHRQTTSEAFSGAGLLDFRGEKQVTLNADYRFPN